MTMLLNVKHMTKEVNKNIFIFFRPENFLKRDIIFWIKIYLITFSSTVK